MRGETASSSRENVCGFGICYGHCDRNNPRLRIAERGNDRLQPVLKALAMLGFILNPVQVSAMKKTLLLIAGVAVLLSGCIVVPDGGGYGYYGGGGYYHHHHHRDWD